MKRFLVFKHGERKESDTVKVIFKIQNLAEGRQVMDPNIFKYHTNSIVTRGHLPLSQTHAKYFETLLQSVYVKLCASGMASCS